MLSRLQIKNFALIEDAEIDFGPGLNIITGETGAGKSILLGALTMILGERASTDFIRTGCERAIIEGVIDCSRQSASEWARQYGSSSLLIRRELSSKGQSRCFIQDGLVSVSELKEFGDAMVDLHGQHEHQFLLRQDVHIDILDDYARLEEDRKWLMGQFEQARTLEKKLQDLRDRKQEFEEKKDHYQFLLKEIDDVSPQAGEDDTLQQEEKLLGHAEKRFALSHEVFGKLYDSEGSVTGVLADVEARLAELASIDSSWGDQVAQFRAARISLEDISRLLGDYTSRIVFDPDRLEEIRQRQVFIQRLKKKYGTLEDILQKQSEYRDYVRLADRFDDEIARMQQEVQGVWDQFDQRASAVAARRKASGEILATAVSRELGHLGMADARFECRIEAIDRTPKGQDRVEFMLSANPGEPPKPLARVASGGEISRIMLAIKTALADSDPVPILVFDEIDVGISGRIAQSVGRALLALSRNRQVICITHLPQIASMSEHHFRVEKSTRSGKTTTDITPVDEDGKIKEVAKLLGGDSLSSASLENARELVNSVR